MGQMSVASASATSRTADGVQLAWAEAGAGPPLVKAANWLTHLEYEWESPVWQHWIRFFSRPLPLRALRRARLRDDATGTSTTSRSIAGSTTWRRSSTPPDVREPFTLLGISQGAAICVAYAVAPSGAGLAADPLRRYARGLGASAATRRAQREYRAMLELMRVGWGRDNPVFRQVFTSRFIPGAHRRADRLVQRALPQDRIRRMAAALLEAARRSTSPTCSRRSGRRRSSSTPASDEVCPVSEGRLLARRHPGRAVRRARLAATTSCSRTSRPGSAFQEAVLEFTGLHGQRGRRGSGLRRASAREREVLALITEGLGNADIGERLAISEKTVRNHISNLFDKLGVWTRRRRSSSRATATSWARRNSRRARYPSPDVPRSLREPSSSSAWWHAHRTG